MSAAILRLIDIAEPSCVLVTPARTAERPPEDFAGRSGMGLAAVTLVEYVVVTGPLPGIVVRHPVSCRARVICRLGTGVLRRPQVAVPHPHPVTDIIVGPINLRGRVDECGRVLDGIVYSTRLRPAQHGAPVAAKRRIENSIPLGPDERLIEEVAGLVLVSLVVGAPIERVLAPPLILQSVGGCAVRRLGGGRAEIPVHKDSAVVQSLESRLLSQPDVPAPHYLPVLVEGGDDSVAPAGSGGEPDAPLAERDIPHQGGGGRCTLRPEPVCRRGIRHLSPVSPESREIISSRLRDDKTVGILPVGSQVHGRDRRLWRSLRLAL